MSGLGFNPTQQALAAAAVTRAAFLAAALDLGGEKTPAGDVDQQEKAKWLADFEQNKAASKPIGL